MIFSRVILCEFTITKHNPTKHPLQYVNLLVNQLSQNHLTNLFPKNYFKLLKLKLFLKPRNNYAHISIRNIYFICSHRNVNRVYYLVVGRINIDRINIDQSALTIYKCKDRNVVANLSKVSLYLFNRLRTKFKLVAG